MTSPNLPTETLLSEFCVTDPEFVDETGIARIWKVKRADKSFAAFKIYLGDNMKNEAPGFEFLRSKNGVGVAEIYQTNHNCALMEWLEGESLGDMVRRGEDQQAAIKLIEVANAIHQDRPELAIDLPHLETWYEDVFDLKYADNVSQDVKDNFATCQHLADELFAQQQDIVALHGDLHHDNIKHSARGFLAFDAKGIVGERAYEIANAFRNPKGGDIYVQDPARFLYLADLWSKEFDVDRVRLLKWTIVKCGWSISRASDGLIKNHKDLDLLDMFIKTAKV